MSCRFVLPFSGSVGSDGAKPASDGIGRQTGKIPGGLGAPVLSEGEMPSEVRRRKNLQSPHALS
ncbi:TPA: hypothetical protein ACFMWC_000830 [Neisseria lactamica]|uniref:hypothetical protein n=1 Tax=Neisseria lactamica TaxID=486 RepID=UPI0027E0075C|nr:hypothetical protein [Neisseria lactamica]